MSEGNFEGDFRVEEVPQMLANNGEPAFASRWQKGMSLRDYLSGQALIGIVARSSSTQRSEEIAERAVELADAVIKLLSAAPGASDESK